METSLTPTTCTQENIPALRKLYEDQLPTIQKHQLTTAKIVAIHKRDIVLTLSGKSDAILPISEFKDLPHIHIGDQVEVYVSEKENKEGDIVVSRNMAQLLKAWTTIREAHKNQASLPCRVKRKIKGGLAVDLKGIEAFLPFSQIATSPVANPDDFVGTDLQVEILNINLLKNNVIVSRRLLIEREQEEQRKKVIAGLQKGQILSGKVKNVTHFGAFIDLGGVIGLVHKNEMTWTKKPTPIEKIVDEKNEPLFTIGKEIQVVVKNFDLESGNIYLSTRLLLPNPWTKFSEEKKEGTIVKGKVKEIMNYGAFVELSDYPEVTGLLHVSDISYASYLDHPSEVIALGDELELKILAMNESKHDLRLGRKQLLPNPWDTEEIMKKYKINTIHEAQVRFIIREGAYLILEPGIEGFVHNSHLSWIKKVYNAAEVLTKKETVKVKILGINQEKKLFELSIKEVEKNPWPTFAKTFQPGTLHKGTITKKVSNGAIVEIPYGILTFVSNKELLKKDKTEVKQGQDLDFVVLNCSPDKELITLSHTATFRKNPLPITPQEIDTAEKNLDFEQNTKNSTLGDFGALSKLRDELRKKEQAEKKALQSKK